MAAIFIASIFALSGLGIAYAAWTDTINIDGTVTTGSLCWEFTGAFVWDDDQPVNPGGDYPTNDPDYTCHPGFVYDPLWQQGYWNELDKNVAWGEVHKKDLDLDGCYETLEVTLHNVYPCNFNAVNFYVRNCGTLPLKVNHIVINGNIYSSGVPYEAFDLDGNGVDDFEIQWGNNWGVQIEPGAPSPEFSFWMHTLQDEGSTIQGGSFTFTISIVAVQWDEYPYTP